MAQVIDMNADRKLEAMYKREAHQMEQKHYWQRKARLYKRQYEAVSRSSVIATAGMYTLGFVMGVILGWCL